MLTSGDTKKHQTRHYQETSRQDQETRSIVIENWANEDANKEDQKEVQTEDPTNLGMVVVAELVLLEIRLKNSTSINETKDCKHAAKGAQDHQPCTHAALGMGHRLLFLFGAGRRGREIRGRCGGSGDGSIG